MKTKSLIILGGVLAASATAVIIKMRSNAGTFSGPSAEVGQTLLTNVPLENVGTMLINDGKNSVEIVNRDGKWVVAGRDNFPASITAVNELTDTAFNLKVQGVEKGVGKSQYGRLGLADAGGEAEGEEIGKTLLFKDSSGNEMSGIVVGKTQEVKASSQPFDMSGPQPRPQWIQVKGQDVIYKTVTGFSKLDGEPKSWLDKDGTFFKVEKLKSIAVTGPTPEESWKISREKDAGDLKLDEPAAGEEFDPAKASSQGTAFAGPSFDDILPEADKAKAALDKPTHTAVIETFDGLTYTVKVGAKVEPPKVDPPKEGETPPTPPENYYVSYTVTGTLGDTPPPYATPAPVAPVEPAALPADADDEAKKKYEEDKKKYDEAKKNHETAMKSWEDGKKAAETTFKTELEKKKERLAAEQGRQTRVFIVAKYTVEPVMKKRSEFMKDKAVTPAAGDAPGAASTPGSTPAVSVTPAAMPPKSPGGKIEAVTPAIEVKLPGTEEPKVAPVVAPVK